MEEGLSVNSSLWQINSHGCIQKPPACHAELLAVTIEVKKAPKKSITPSSET